MFIPNSKSHKLHGRVLHISFAVCNVTVSKVQQSPRRHTWLNRSFLPKKWLSTMLEVQSFSDQFLAEEDGQTAISKGSL